MKPFDKNTHRLSRMYYFTACAVIALIYSILDAVLIFEYANGNESVNIYLVLLILGKIFQIVYLFFLTLKRFHDAGYSTGYYILCLVLSFLIIGLIMIRVAIVQRSDEKNEWGEKPIIY